MGVDRPSTRRFPTFRMRRLFIASGIPSFPWGPATVSRRGLDNSSLSGCSSLMAGVLSDIPSLEGEVFPSVTFFRLPEPGFLCVVTLSPADATGGGRFAKASSVLNRCGYSPTRSMSRMACMPRIGVSADPGKTTNSCSNVSSLSLHDKQNLLFPTIQLSHVPLIGLHTSILVPPDPLRISLPSRVSAPTEFTCAPESKRTEVFTVPLSVGKVIGMTGSKHHCFLSAEPDP